MTIAGSDSAGGAGLQADLKTFAALGVFGTSVVTAVTAQNTADVLGILTLDPYMVDLQMTAVLDDMPVAAVKTGMLANAPIVAAVARRAVAGELPDLIVDPVLVTTTGRALLDDAGVRAYLDLLLPQALLLTPNVREAAVLVGRPVDWIDDVEKMESAGRLLLERGARNVLVKGGHLRGEESPDVLVGSDIGETGQVTVLGSTRVETANDHGTGCSLSAAVAALLASGTSLPEAVEGAKSFVTRAIQGASEWSLGRGHGPLDHFGWSRRCAE